MSAKIPGENDNDDDDDGDDTRLVSVRLYARRRPLLRLDVLPFVLSYTVATTAFFGVPSLEVHALIACWVWRPASSRARFRLLESAVLGGDSASGRAPDLELRSRVRHPIRARRLSGPIFGSLKRHF